MCLRFSIFKESDREMGERESNCYKSISFHFSATTCILLMAGWLADLCLSLVYGITFRFSPHPGGRVVESDFPFEFFFSSYVIIIVAVVVVAFLVYYE